MRSFSASSLSLFQFCLFSFVLFLRLSFICSWPALKSSCVRLPSAGLCHLETYLCICERLPRMHHGGRRGHGIPWNGRRYVGAGNRARVLYRSSKCPEPSSSPAYFKPRQNRVLSCYMEDGGRHTFWGGRRGRWRLSNRHSNCYSEFKGLFPKWTWIQVAARASHALRLDSPTKGLTDAGKLGKQQPTVEGCSLQGWGGHRADPVSPPQPAGHRMASPPFISALDGNALRGRPRAVRAVCPSRAAVQR